MEYKIGLIVAVISLILLTLFIILEEDKRNKIFSLFKSKVWIINFILIIAWSIFIQVISPEYLEKDKKKLLEANNKAIIAFIIAFFAYIDITTIPFWLVFTFAYYTELV